MLEISIGHPPQRQMAHLLCRAENCEVGHGLSLQSARPPCGVFMYIHAHTHTHTYIYIYISVRVHVSFHVGDPQPKLAHQFLLLAVTCLIPRCSTPAKPVDISSGKAQGRYPGIPLRARPPHECIPNDGCEPRLSTGQRMTKA